MYNSVQKCFKVEKNVGLYFIRNFLPVKLIIVLTKYISGYNSILHILKVRKCLGMSCYFLINSRNNVAFFVCLLITYAYVSL